jgi:type III pantothenate kinase
VISLIIDIGNTRTKVALFNRGELMISFPVDTFTPHNLELLLADYPGINKAILSSVREGQEELVSALTKSIPFFIELDHLTPLPIVNGYKTPGTLGKDRIAAAVGANKLYPNKNVLIIDAGTAITYDLINEQGCYKGGFISPGLRMRFKALHHFTDKLPLIEPVKPVEIEGLDTPTSISGGIQYGLEGEILNMIHYFSEKYGKLTIILTGGDTNYFERIIKNYKFVALEITLLGLNTILEFNYLQHAERQH